MKPMNYTLRKRLTQICFQLLLLFGSLFILAPLAIMVLGSFKDVKEAAELSLSLPSVWHFENYQVVFEKGEIGQAMINSTIITVSSVVVTLISSSLASFYLARCNNAFSRRIMSVFMMGLIAPISLIPTITLLQKLHINNTYFGVIMVFCSLNMAFSVLLFTGFIKTIPRQLDEAAVMDGCGPIRTFFLVIFPLLLPVIVTGIIVVFMNVWNNFMIPLYFLSDSSKWPTPLTVYNFFGKYQSSWNLVFADLVMTALPILLVYLLGQKYIIDGMTTGAVKG